MAAIPAITPADWSNCSCTDYSDRSQPDVDQLYNERFGDLLAGDERPVVELADEPVDQRVEVGFGRQLAALLGALLSALQRLSVAGRLVG